MSRADLDPVTWPKWAQRVGVLLFVAAMVAWVIWWEANDTTQYRRPDPGPVWVGVVAVGFFAYIACMPLIGWLVAKARRQS